MDSITVDTFFLAPPRRREGVSIFFARQESSLFHCRRATRYRFNYKRPFDSNLNIKKDLCGGSEVKEKWPEDLPPPLPRCRCFRFINVNGCCVRNIPFENNETRVTVYYNNLICIGSYYGAGYKSRPAGDVNLPKS